VCVHAPLLQLSSTSFIWATCVRIHEATWGSALVVVDLMPVVVLSTRRAIRQWLLKSSIM
jgi:hypothetical protein